MTPQDPWGENLNKESTFTWSVRVVPADGERVTSYCRTQSFGVHKQASFDKTDAQPSAVEYFLGALAADLTLGFRKAATRRGLETDELEMSLSGVLRNPLVVLGVVGETGETGFEVIRGTMYVHVECSAAELDEVWSETLWRSPLYNTLKLSVAMEIGVRQIL
jgi:hypothetical protein